MFLDHSHYTIKRMSYLLFFLKPYCLMSRGRLTTFKQSFNVQVGSFMH